MIASIDTSNTTQAETPFLGLAPFLRRSISGVDMRPLAQEMLARLEHESDNANLLMNLATVMQCLEQPDVALAIQTEALALQRVYHLAAAQQPAKLRLLMVMVPGDLAANTPLDCLLENSDIDLDFYYTTPGDPFALPVPEHDALIVTINECDENHALLDLLEEALNHWPKPVINAPQNIRNTDRNTASILLQNVPGLLIPPSLRVSRQTLMDISTGKISLCSQFADGKFPVIIRPPDSYGGHGLDKVESAEAISHYLSKVESTSFFLSPFIDYSSEDGLFRKFRLALVNGKPYACHLAVSSNWMIHYLNAGMYEDAGKRAEEADFMAYFNDFMRCHKTALNAIYSRSKLDYFCIDCAQTRDGELLIFEIDHVMVVHAMDPEDLFPYKQAHMHKIQNAFREYLIRLTSNHTTDQSS